uniref:Pentapeptide repeat-containing protein n=1 Tax=Cystobacterineae bacterium TaxID=1934914 RepID=A0A3Q8I261_9BACT|nr:pentapeptide repeat-containing protein [Myxococcaceae bacterium MCy9487]
MTTEENASTALLRRLKQDDSFENESFTELDLQGADLSDKEFYKCTFQGCELQESRWKGTNLETCVFQGCNLTRAILNGTRLRGVRFGGSKLMGIDWTGVSSNPEVEFEECGMRYSSFVGISLRKTSWLRCVAPETNFFDIDLTDSDFSGTDLTGSNFRGCTLTRTDFSGATGLMLDPAQNRMKDTRVPVETAMGLAYSLGMIVDGYHAKVPVRAGPKKAR